MPEGDSVHRAAHALGVLVGERIEAESPHPRGQATGVAARADGRVLESVEPVGKNLLLRFEGGVVVRSHLRLSGRWRVGPRGAVRTGRPWLILRGGEHEAQLWNGPVLELARPLRLGPDILAPGLDVASVQLRGPIAEALLDQRRVAGIGNIWCSEALWHARLAPFAPALPGDTAAVLAHARRLMQDSVAGGRPTRAVHRRTGRPCLRCGTPIRASGVGDDNRTVYWCPRCQAGEERPDA